MVGVVRRVGEWIFGLKNHSTAVSPDRQTVYSFDLEGRPVSWYERDRVEGTLSLWLSADRQAAAQEVEVYQRCQQDDPVPRLLQVLTPPRHPPRLSITSMAR